MLKAKKRPTHKFRDTPKGARTSDKRSGRKRRDKAEEIENMREMTKDIVVVWPDWM
jgi:hypothetical protein